MKYKMGTVSIQGSYHDINQDRAIAMQFPFGSVLALADGLGSRNLSQFGAQTFCDCVVDLAKKYECLITNDECFITELQNLWVQQLKLQNFDVKQCYCTALIAIVKNNTYKIFKLGDGIISLMADDEFFVFMEEKDDFANFTDPLTESVEVEKWQTFSGMFKRLQGIFLCSDGVEIGDSSVNVVTDFHNDFIEEYTAMSVLGIEKQIKEWLKDWPTSDDKTIAFLLREES